MGGCTLELALFIYKVTQSHKKFRKYCFNVNVCYSVTFYFYIFGTLKLKVKLGPVRHEWLYYLVILA
jgi:hypothetical protein